MFKYFVDQDGYVWTLNYIEKHTPYPHETMKLTSHFGWDGIELYGEDGYLIDEFELHDSLTDLVNTLEPPINPH